ncbi:hypothetical protein C6P40_003896 [Pichia californica]|uniref:Maintenance of telomere capping protein 1 n=1 Tax=Pichia californica TaxID=460514 RepID=A0A9P6WN68_9ASCO|nr:hypothetical protein C6P40_003896 [[Candida] californica]
MPPSTDEKEIFDFLDSLPTDTNSAVNSTNTATTTNATIGTKDSNLSSETNALDFLDELEGKKTSVKKEVSNSKEKPTKEEAIKEEAIKEEAIKEEPIKEENKDQQHKHVEPPLINNEPVNDPITSIASWWSSTGSSKVSSQLTSLWGTAQSIGEQAQKQAEDAIKKAREQSIEDNIRTAFKELGISGVRENINDMLTEEQRAELMKLPVPDAKKALESLNSGLNLGLSFVEGTLNEAITRINALNNKDEIIEIIVVHDMKNFIGLTDMIKLSFEDVMSQQVDGSIDVNVYESGTIKPSTSSTNESIESNNIGEENRIIFSLFNGKGSDAEKLVMANIENEIKRRTKKKDNLTNETVTSDSSVASTSAASTSEGDIDESSSTVNEKKLVKKTTIYISLLAWTSNKDNTVINSKEVVIDSHSSSSFTISCVLKDESHGISINSQSQPLPLKWGQWIEGNFEDGEKEEDIDPGEWVIEWIKNTVANVIGVTSQTYILKRMGY